MSMNQIPVSCPGRDHVENQSAHHAGTDVWRRWNLENTQTAQGNAK